MDYFIHPKGICESKAVGKGSKIWAFSHVLPEAQMGEDCNINDHVFIENDVVLGNRVTVKSGVQLWDGARVGDDVFIGPNVTFTNDKFPRSKQYPEKFESISIESKASIGANATLLPGISIGREAMVGAGAVVTKSVPPKAIVQGNPARIVGYVDTSDSETKVIQKSSTLVELPVGELVKVPTFEDMRGSLSVMEFDDSLPFSPKRIFNVFDVPSQYVRGEHAHKVCEQLLVAIKGSVNVVLDNGQDSCEVVLDSPGSALHIPARVWGVQYKFSPGAILTVLASHPYNSEDYIRNYYQFLAFIAD